MNHAENERRLNRVILKRTLTFYLIVRRTIRAWYTTNRTDPAGSHTIQPSFAYNHIIEGCVWIRFVLS